ncbi:hypothetical protein BJ742DRAFT_673761 [Cladochytrium replicatum]|nr:hypothetical protein BJ742DRAFT_673761 [Cladochytrium replicatum]
MSTGDHPKTAAAIAREIGILPPLQRSGSKRVMTAAEFDNLTEEEIDKMEELPVVLARRLPQTKAQLIKALHRRGKFVAMTGDSKCDLILRVEGKSCTGLDTYFCHCCDCNCRRCAWIE